MKRHLKSTFFVKAAIALTLFLAQSGNAFGTSLVYTFTMQDLLQAYDAAAEPGFGMYDVGLVDLFARPDDPDVAYSNIVWFPAPTFAGSPIAFPWGRNVTTSAPGFTGGSPWAHTYDKLDSLFVYMTAFTGEVLVDDEIPAYQITGNPAFHVAIDVAPGDVAGLLGQSMNFRFSVERSQWTCTDASVSDIVDCNGGAKAFGTSNKRETPISFAMTLNPPQILTPEPSSAVLGGAGLLVLFLKLRRRA